MAQPPARNAVIDLLRAGCVLYIVGFWHLMTYTPFFPGYHNPVTARITVAVLALFMFISGLCASESLARCGGNARAFYRKRVLRIYPLFVLAALLFLAFKLANGAALLRALLMISPLWGKQPMTLWFIANLCLYCLLLPLIVRQGSGRRRFWLLALGIELVLCAAPQFSGTDTRAAIYFPAFCLGTVFATQPPRKLWPWLLASVVALGASLLACGDPEQALVSIALALSLPVLLYFGALRLLPHLTLPRGLSALACAGFAAYLLHRVIFRLLDQALSQQAAEVRLAGLVLLGVPLVFAFAYALQRGYDKLLQRHQARHTAATLKP